MSKETPAAEAARRSAEQLIWDIQMAAQESETDKESQLRAEYSGLVGRVGYDPMCDD